MKRLKLIVASLFLSVGLFAAQQQAPKSAVKELDVNNFSKGLDSYHDSTIIPDGYVQDADNVYFDRQAPVEKRQGFTVAFTSKSYSYNTAWTYTDATNTTWIIVRASDSVIANNFNGSTVVIATVSINNQVDEANAFGNAYFVDPTQGVYFWNGSSVTFIVGSPHGSIIAQFHSRVWVAGQAVPFGNQLYASAFLDGTTWSTQSGVSIINPGDSSQFTIGLQDNFDNITALYPFLDTLYVMKYTSMYALYGFDNTNFQNSIINRECGCIDKYSIQAYNKGVVFADLRGLEYFDGYNCNRISDSVKNKIDPAIQFTSFNQQSWAQSTIADWNAGGFTTPDAFSTAEFPPALSLSTATGSFTDNTNAAFQAGTLNNITIGTNTIAMTVLNSSNVWDGSFESGAGGLDLNWSGLSTGFQGQITTNVNNCTAQDGSYFAALQGGCFGGTGCSYSDNRVINSFNFRIVDLNGNILQDTSLPLTQNTCTWTQQTVTRNDLIGRAVKIVLYSKSHQTIPSTQDNVTFSTTSRSYIWGGSMSFWETCAGTGGAPDSGPEYGCFIDNLTLGVSTVTSGTFTSQTFDTAISSTIIAAQLGVSSTSASEPMVVTLQTSPDGSSWSNLTAAVNTLINSNRFLRYQTVFTLSVGPGFSGGPGLDNNSTMNFAAIGYNFTRSSGSFRSQSHALGPVNSFGNFAVQDTLTNASIVFSICTSPNSNMIPSLCQSQAPNTPITITSNTYVNWYATFTVTTATSNATLNGVTVQWFAGSKSNPMASAVFDNRYWLAITTNPFDTTNDAVLVMNTNTAFSIFDIHAGGLVVVKNNLYHSDSSATGNVDLDNQGFNDNGIPINAYIRTRDYNMGSAINDTLLDSLWPSMVNLGNFSVKISYALDKGLNNYSLATVNQNEFSSTKFAKVPFPMNTTTPGVGQTINFFIQASDLSEPLQLEGMTLLYHERPILE